MMFLSTAAMNNKEDVVNYLIENKANSKSINKDGNTAFMLGNYYLSCK